MAATSKIEECLVEILLRGERNIRFALRQEFSKRLVITMCIQSFKKIEEDRRTCKTTIASECMKQHPE